MHALAAVLDLTLIGELAQHPLEGRPVGVLGAERAGDLAGADLAGMLANEGDQLFARGKAFLFHRALTGGFVRGALPVSSAIRQLVWACVRIWRRAVWAARL